MMRWQQSLTQCTSSLQSKTSCKMNVIYTNVRIVQKDYTKIKNQGQTWSPQHMPMAISANWAVLAAFYMVYDAATTPTRSVNKHWWCLEEKMASLCILWPSKATRKTFLGKTRTFRPNKLPKGFEILQRLGTHLLSLNPEKLQILVWDFEPLFKVISGSLGCATGVSKKTDVFYSPDKNATRSP